VSARFWRIAYRLSGTHKGHPYNGDDTVERGIVSLIRYQRFQAFQKGPPDPHFEKQIPRRATAFARASLPGKTDLLPLEHLGRDLDDQLFLIPFVIKSIRASFFSGS